MRYQISGKQIDIGTALQTHVEQELGDTVEKYGGNPTEATVIFSKTGSELNCEVIVHLSTGITCQARGAEHGIYEAFESARAKLDKQLRRYKRRLKDHHKARSEPVELFAGASYILASSDDSGEQEPEDVNAMIIAETEAKIPSLSVGEAVMQMELAHNPVQVFKNEKHGGINVVYRRDDGNIGWIDPA